MRKISEGELKAATFLDELRQHVQKRQREFRAALGVSKARRIGRGINPVPLSTWIRELAEIMHEDDFREAIEECHAHIAKLQSLRANIYNRELAEDAAWAFPKSLADTTLPELEDALFDAQRLMETMEEERDYLLACENTFGSNLRPRIDELTVHADRLRPHLESLEAMHLRTGRPR